MKESFFSDFCDKSNGCEYVSFDIFDTLIKRNIDKPSDVFKLIESEYNRLYDEKIHNFLEDRMAAESVARRKASGEVTLDDIYIYLNKYNDNIKLNLKKIEKKIEISICQFNNDLKDVYEWAKNNKKIIITSDMYLSEEVIKEILDKNNIVYEKLYLSSVHKKRKKDGSLFEFILKDLKIDSKKIIHIGDNEQSDYLNPKKYGIKSLIYSDKLYIDYYDKSQIRKNLSYNLFCSFVKNNIQRKNYFYNVGYECYGIILYNFIKWLNDELDKENIKKIYFLARDGKIIKNAFDLINNNSNKIGYYFYASRRSIIVPSLWKYSNIDEILNSINIPKKLTITDLKKRLGLDDCNIDEILKKYSLNVDEIYSLEKIKTEKYSFLEELYDLIVCNSKKEYECFMNYKNKLDFEGKVAIVDIGWLGNMQLALSNMCKEDTEIYGYYLGLRHNKKRSIKTKGYMFDVDKNTKFESQQMLFNSIFEFIFSAVHGSVKRFSDNSDFVELYPSENDNEYEKNALISIQNGALDFIRDYEKNDIKSFIFLNEIDTFNNLYKLLYKPTREDATNFGQILFKDGDIRYIAKKDNIFKFSSFKNSLWKIGYMRRNIKLNFPFDKIYKFIKFVKK